MASQARFSLLRDSGPRGGGALGGSLICPSFMEALFRSGRHGTHDSPEMAARR